MKMNIRLLLKDGLTELDIASQYGVSSSTINDIKHCRTWKHI